MKIYLLSSEVRQWGEGEGRGIYQAYSDKAIAEAERDRLNMLDATDVETEAQVYWIVNELDILDEIPEDNTGEWFVNTGMNETDS